MPSTEEIQLYLTGAWRLMLGKADGIKLLDVSVDGFWNSFYAILVALPPLAAGWVVSVNAIPLDPAGFGARLSLLVRLAAIDVFAWIFPLVVLALVARQVGIADRFAHYVVASNWGSALLVWMMLPPALIMMFWPQAADAAGGLAVFLFIVTQFLAWRLTNGALAKGPAIASALFFSILIGSIMLIVGLQNLFIPA